MGKVCVTFVTFLILRAYFLLRSQKFVMFVTQALK